MESVYPHENLKNLYTKTTVSELKKAGMEEAAEEAYHLFEEKELVPYPALSGRKKRSAGPPAEALTIKRWSCFLLPNTQEGWGGRLPAERLTRQR